MDRSWHTLTIDQALKALDTSQEGLSVGEAEQRLQAVGPNIVPEAPPKTLLSVYLGQFKNAFIYLLLIAAAISLALQELGDAIFIAIALQINAIIGTIQESQAQGKALALKSLVKSTIAVRRDKKWEMIDGSGLVPGDIVNVEAGTLIPAALKLLTSEVLEVDESLLTGESVPVLKNTTALLPKDASLASQINLLHAGSTVLRGRATGVVTATGARTEVGRVAESLKFAQQVPPPLIRRMETFTHIVAGLMVGVIALIAMAEYARGSELSAILLTCVALAVAAIPEGLPVALTVALSISVSRMARRNVVVRKLPAVEGLGACTMIAADKTGTLTINELSVELVYLPRFGDISTSRLVGGAPSPAAMECRAEFDRLVTTGLLCNEAWLEEQTDGSMVLFGDSVDGAILELADRIGIDRNEVDRANVRRGRIPYEPVVSFAASFHDHDGDLIAHVKGAAEIVLTFCQQAEVKWVLHEVNRLARQGYRVLALARGSVSGIDRNALQALEFLGLIALMDPLRPGAIEAIHRCRNAGVTVRMITGDHPLTALEIGKQLDMAESDEDVVTGSQLAALEQDQTAFDAVVARGRIFARTGPMQKHAIVQSMQRAGHIVAVTGDGVNDVSALAVADIGAAMGKSGTDIARSAADLIVADDNLASLADAIEEGRIAYDNIRKVIYLLISTGAAELVLFLASIAAGLPLPLSPVQLLWLNLVTQGIQDVALAFEKGERDILKRPPRQPKEGIFDRQMIEQTVLSGLFVGGAAFIFFLTSLNAGQSTFDATNQLLLFLTLFVNAHVFNCRSETRSIFQIPIRNNPFLVWGVIAVQIIHIGAMNVPGLALILDIEPVSFETWIRIALPALSIIVVMEIYKLFLRSVRRTV